jgi:hypothetical protein
MSPTIPYVATLKMGASGSLLMARITLDDCMPMRCCIWPDMPQAIYNFGHTVLPVCPTWCEYGIHPASTVALEAPTAAPKTLASLFMCEKFSGPPTPLPPETIISASERFIVSSISSTISIILVRANRRHLRPVIRSYYRRHYVTAKCRTRLKQQPLLFVYVKPGAISG